MPKSKKKCDESLERWFNEVLERIKKSTGARTQVQLAEVLDVRQSSISDAKRRCSVPADWFLKLYRSHGLSPDWLAHGTEPVYLNPSRSKISAETLVRETPAPFGKPHSRSRVVPVCSMAPAKGANQTWEPVAVDDLSIPESFYRPELVVVKMDSTGMEPIICRGAFVGIDTAQKNCPDGDFCAVHFPKQGLLVRRIYFQNGQYVLRAEKDYSDIQIPAEDMKQRIVGRVVWVLQNITPM